MLALMHRVDSAATHYTIGCLFFLGPRTKAKCNVEQAHKDRLEQPSQVVLCTYPKVVQAQHKNASTETEQQ